MSNMSLKLWLGSELIDNSYVEKLGYKWYSDLRISCFLVDDIFYKEMKFHKIISIFA